jgi:transcriptional regulator with XRE-family HTH domain
MAKISPLRQVRFDLQLTQERLAVKSGVGQAKISQYERGITRPSEKNKARLAEALGVFVDKIFPEGGGN